MDLKNIPRNSTEAQTLIDKYKFFYFSKYPLRITYRVLTIRRNGRIELAAYEQWKSRNPQSTDSAGDPSDDSESPPDPSRPWFEQTPNRNMSASMAPDAENEPQGPSFDEIVELISTGKPVPGIRQIPDQLNKDPPSTSSSPVPPKKPWEK